METIKGAPLGPRVVSVEPMDNYILSFGSIAWDNDIDYCPDTLYEESLPFVLKS